MKTQANLIRDGFEAVAGHAQRIVKARRKSTVLLVRANGRVRLEYPSKVDDADAADMVGCYTASTPIELIEDDLLVRQREIAGAAA